MATSKLQAFWNHPAGPKTIHFWAPTFKWVISLANVADFTKPPENISYPQQCVVACSGVIWSRYSLIINPYLENVFGSTLGITRRLPSRSLILSVVLGIHDHIPHQTKQRNWNLFCVNMAMGGTGIYQLSRKYRHDSASSSNAEEAVVEE